MNHVYRIVWNNAVRAWVAVAETVRGRGKSSQSARPVAVSIAAALAAVLGTGIAHAQATPSVVVAPGQQTNAYVSGNGVTVVNIANPNSAGLSHNRYQQFNVNTSGLVLNNTTTQQISYSSQLAGQIMANQNTASTASVILNEVVSNNRSTLAGFTEVLGRKADVVLANPYGITCSGCGFINTDRVTLSTGLPFMRADGSLGGFNVSQGDILVTGTGLNATAQQVLDLVTRSVRIEGAINAQDLGVTTGTNQWDYGTRAITGSVAAQGTAPAYAIDSSALGGMYANRIKLTATEAGVGVRMLGDAAASADDFTLTAAGRVELSNKISAQRDVMIASTSNDAAAVALTGATAAAGRSITVTADQGALGINASTLIAGADLKASGTRIEAGQGTQLQAGGTLSANATAGDLVLGAAAVRSTGDMNLASTGAVSIGGGDGQAVQSTGGQISIDAQTGLTNSGVVSADQGSVTLRAGSQIANSGTINAGQNLDIADATGGASQSLDNTGILLAGQTMSTRAATIGNSGWMQAGSANTIDAASLDNSGKVIAVTGTATLRVDGTLDNSGSVRAAQDIIVTGHGGNASQQLSNSGDLLAAGAVNLQASSLANSAAGWIQAATGTTVAAGTLDNAGTWLLSQQAGGVDHVDVTGALSNAGTMQSAGAVALSAATLDNRHVLVAAGDLSAITSGALNNSDAAVLQAGGTLSLISGTTLGNGTAATLSGAGVALKAAQGLTNDGTISASAGDTIVRASGAIANSGKIHAAGVLDLADASGGATETLDNSGQLIADGAIAAASTDLLNKNGGKLLGDRLDIHAASIDNAGIIQGGSAADSTVTANGTLTNESTGVLTMGVASGAATAGAGTVSASTIANDGTLQSQGGLTLALGTGGLSGTGDVLAAGDLAIRAQGSNDYTANIGGALQSAGALSVKGGAGSTLAVAQGRSASGNTVDIDVGTIDLQKDAVLASSGDMTLHASSLQLAGDTASTARVLAAQGGGSATVNVDNALTNNGLLFSGGDLNLTAPQITNGATGGIAALGTLTATASKGDFTNAGALYGGTALVANALQGTLTNTGTRTAYVGSIDSDGAITLNAKTLVNQSAVNAGTDLTVNATYIQNVVYGGDDRTWVTGPRTTTQDDHQKWDGGNGYRERWDYTDSWTMYQQYASGVAPGVKPLLSAGRTLNANFYQFDNIGGVVSADTVNLVGTATGARFINDDLALNRQYYQSQYFYYIHWQALVGASATYNDTGWYQGHCASGDDCYTGNSTVLSQSDAIARGQSQTGADVISSIGAGVYARSLTAGGFALYNNGSTGVAADDSTIQVARAGDAQAVNVAKTGSGNGLTPQDLASTSGGVSAVGGSAFAGAGSATLAAGRSFLAANAADGVAGLSFGGINVTLPTNPNGYFVTVKTPGALYLVESNPLYMAGSATVGSDYLAKLLGYNPDQIGQRLGDASYEAYLVKQQLIAQTGNTLLASYQSAGTQMQGLMENAAQDSQALGLQFGKALTPEQQAALKHDIVWMVQTEVDGKVVLAPVVYLAQSTKNTIATGAVISAQDANLNLTSLTNTGGTIVGGKSLVIASTGDITNLSGTIKGGDLSLTSTEGSIVNKTASSGSGNDQFYNTVVGKNAGIESTGTLTLDAAKDITNIGATMAAGTDASLKAGGNVTFDTIEKKTTNTTVGEYKADHGSGGTSTTTTTVEQLTSGLTVGGNMSVDAGKNITLAGTDAKVGGNADLKAGGDLNIIARENSTTTHTESKASGFGMNNSLYGSTTTTTDSLSVRNVGSSLQVGGDASFTAGRDMTVQGSDLNVKGKGDINATNLNVLAGRNYDETNTTTKSTGVMQVSASGKGSASADASADASSARGRASASAEASAGASGTGAAGLAFSSTTTTTTNTTDLKHVGSSLDFGGDLTVNASKDVNLQGSSINAGGTATVNAQNVNLLAAEDKSTSSTTTTTTSVGLMASTDNKIAGDAGASAQAAGGKGTPSAGAQASADVSATSENHLDFAQHTKTTADTLDTTHQGSAINAGGNLNVNATGTLALEGSSMKSGGDMNLNATDMSFKAVNDVHQVSTTSNTTTAGIYVTGQASASGSASANAALGAQAGAQGSASASVEAGLYGSNTKTSSVDGSTHAVTSSLSSGGNINRTATNSISDQGTQIEGAGNLNQSAKTITSTAAADTTYSSSSSTTNTAKLGGYGEVGASASADASVGPGASKPTQKDKSVGGGIRASYQYDNSSDQSSSSTAVVSTIKMGGSVNSKSSGTTTLEGTQISAGKDVSLEASSLDYKAAQNTSSSSSKSTSAGGSVSVDLVKKEASAGVNYDGSNGSSSSSAAVVGGIQAGGNLSVKTTGDTRLEGTNLSAGGAASIDAGGKVDFAAAKNTASSGSQEVGVDVGVTAGKSGGSGSAGVGYSGSKSSQSEDVAGSITSGSGPLTIKSGGDASFTGTQISSQQGDVSVSAGGALNFNAAHNVQSSSSVSVDVSGSASGGKKENVGGTRGSDGKKTGGETMDERSGSASLGVGTSKSNSDTATGGGITSGGSIKLSSGGNTTLEGTQVKAANGVTADASGSFVQKEAKSTSSSQTVDFSASASGSSLTPEKKKTGTSSPAPAPKPASTTGGKTGASKPPSTPPPPTPTTAPSPAPAPATTAAKAPVSPNQQQKGSGIVDVYVDNQKSSSSQATTIDGGAGGVVIKQGTAGSK
ncbi:filamentous hemagglutinin family N-terminal domain-containing protein [Variovorax sp. HW608]|uniref:hemagglutinin repeat-containing protein n=1 Tax=Variovorax sp. HW608 TaxID=1034889 RepID=UPI00081FF557|nr:hemagglutinin repeat-containing protein [Variovorax sp. HW608]SCK08658.1 filamentous hemagglutinin family N-terminal domain-containing protein [Variovorax sp. HW608]